VPRSTATTVDEYLAELPGERREVVSRIRQTILQHLPDGYQEALRWGMISYEIPLSSYPATYNGQPLAYVALAAQKSYYALYLMGAYAEPGRAEWLAERFAADGKKLDMGKSCLRFRRVEDLALGAVAEVIASTPPGRFIKLNEAVHAPRGSS
jgi:hypothetical protein